MEGYEKLGDEKTEEVSKKGESFEKSFRLIEQNALRCFAKDGAMTSVGLARTLHIPLKTSKDLIKSLRQKNAIINAGRDKRKMKWQITQSVKRMMVKR